MEHQRNLTVETLTRGMDEMATGRGYALARLLSQIFHPMILSIISFLLVGFFALPRWWEGVAWAVLGIALFVVPPAIFFSVRLRQGAYVDEDVSVRQQRNELYRFSMVNLLVGFALLVLLQAPLPFIALLCSAALLAAVAWVINLFWKISVHAASAAACATIAAMYAATLGIFFWGCALLVAWARIRTRNHTPLQVLAGAALAAACVLMMFAAFGLL